MCGGAFSHYSHSLPFHALDHRWAVSTRSDGTLIFALCSHIIHSNHLRSLSHRYTEFAVATMSSYPTGSRSLHLLGAARRSHSSSFSVSCTCDTTFCITTGHDGGTYTHRRFAILAGHMHFTQLPTGRPFRPLLPPRHSDTPRISMSVPKTRFLSTYPGMFATDLYVAASPYSFNTCVLLICQVASQSAYYCLHAIAVKYVFRFRSFLRMLYMFA